MTSKNKFYSLFLVIAICILGIGLTYAFFQVQNSGSIIRGLNVITHTTDVLSFNVSNDINISINQLNFQKNGSNISRSTTATATLIANNKTNTASDTYNLFLVIDDNSFTYTTENEIPEIVFTVTDPNGNMIQSIKGLNGSNGIFDITNRVGAYKIAGNYPIEVNNSDRTIHDWTVTVTFVNLNTNQVDNGGSSFSGKLYITKEKMDTYELPIINSIITSNYQDIDEVENSFIDDTSIDVKLNIATGTENVDKYYYAIEEYNGVSKNYDIIRLANNEEENEYIEYNKDHYKFNNLNSNANYKIKAYVKDKNGFMSNVYETIVNTNDYLMPQVTGMDLTVNNDSITAVITSHKGTNNITGYSFNCGSGWSEAQNSKTYTCENVEPGHTYTISAKAIDSNSISSVIYTDIITVEENYTNNKNRTRELVSLYDSLEVSNNTVKKPEYDFVQPWYFNEMSKQDVEMYFKRLKRAKYKGIVLQYSLDVQVQNNTPVITSSWYDSNLIDDTTSLEVYKPNVLSRILSVAEDLNMEVFIGLGNPTDYWVNDTIINGTWINTTKNFYNSMISEIKNEFDSYDSFVGWYWPIEMYSSTMENFEIWSTILNSNIANLDEKPIMISPFISALYDVSDSNVKAQWDYFMSNTNFRSNDIINLQDCLGTSILKPKVVHNYIEIILRSINDSNKNVDFWLNVENYKGTDSADIDRYYEQLKIASLYASKLTSFSYSHYYLNNSLDSEYRKFMKINDTIIATPTGGSIYEDINGEEVPVPVGFTVSNDNNVVKNGLVIKDGSNNEFVWIPVNGGVKNSCYTYLDEEYRTVYYSRYLNNNVLCNAGSNDTLPVSSDTEQIIKYGGFYVGRYESSFDYNNGSFRPMIKKSTNASTSFYYDYADSSYYTGFLWNNINYTNAKSVSENMANDYNYDSTVKTGLINGVEWDTILRWMHVNDRTYSMIFDSRNYGNYSDASGNATNGNYEQGALKPSGSNDNWAFLSIYDMAGNLREWTSEVIESNHVIRTADYNSTGINGSLSYAEAAASYAYPNVGFRIVLYID